MHLYLILFLIFIVLPLLIYYYYFLAIKRYFSKSAGESFKNAVTTEGYETYGVFSSEWKTFLDRTFPEDDGPLILYKTRMLLISKYFGKLVIISIYLSALAVALAFITILLLGIYLIFIK